MKIVEVQWQSVDQFLGLAPAQILVLYGTGQSLNDEDMAAYLSQKERQKADLMIRNQRDNWVTAHAILRYFCGKLLHKNPLEVDFQITENGKPYLENSPFHFNLSHTDQSFVIAFSSHPVGVDMELVSANFGLSDVVEYAFSTEEKEYCRSADDQSRFFEIWTAKEAICKAMGHGLSNQMKTLNVIGSGSQMPNVNGFVMNTFFCPTNEIATLAYHPSIHSIRFFQLGKNFSFCNL